MAYSKEDIEETFERIVIGIGEDGESLRSVLMRHSMPGSETFYKWIDQDIIKAKRYARACDERAERIADEILEIADFAERDTKIVGEDQKEVPDHEWISRSKLRVDTRKWLLGKLNPKKYGTKMVDVTSGGEPIQQQVISIDPLKYE